jgi:hypothetical protein
MAKQLALQQPFPARGAIDSHKGTRTGNPIPERSAQRILKAADQILRAGTTAPNAAEVL